MLHSHASGNMGSHNHGQAKPGQSRTNKSQHNICEYSHVLQRSHSKPGRSRTTNPSPADAKPGIAGRSQSEAGAKPGRSRTIQPQLSMCQNTLVPQRSQSKQGRSRTTNLSQICQNSHLLKRRPAKPGRSRDVPPFKTLAALISWSQRLQLVAPLQHASCSLL